LPARVEVRLEKEALDAPIVPCDPGARRCCGLARQILARGVPGRVVEARVDHAPGGVALDVLEPARACGRLGGLADVAEVLVHPAPERPRLARAREDEHRRAP